MQDVRGVNMEAELLSKASEIGIWALSCVALVYYILKEQEKRDLRQEERESKYQEIIQDLTSSLTLLRDLDDDIKELKNMVKENTQYNKE